MATENVINTLMTGLVKEHGWIVVLIVLFPLLKLFMPKIKGRIGEGVVNLAAKLRLDQNVYHLLKDVTIPAKRGTTQIDHVIVSPFGLFVIETKNYKGWIYADAKSPQWTQVNFKQKHRFQNPLRQNYAHICALSELLELPKGKIIGVVCFMGDAKFKTGVPEGVFLEGRYVNHIESFQTPVFSDTEVADLIQRIESGRLQRGARTNREHVQRLKTGHESSSTGTPCPRCGAGMVLRTAKKGPTAGNQFWGCSKYPACKAIRPA
ncbi:MAG: NERD domain-containing protein [Verrucomicrobia bacterium]|nr:NERD domain-containing protein [Verrucomicrobiota bacterium]